MSTALETGIARVHGVDGQVVGGGFLIGSETVLTCAHVVARALGRPDDERPPAGAEVRLDFPLAAPGQMLAARVVIWEGPRPDNTGDIAGLVLAGRPPTEARATRLLTAEDLWSHRFRVFGFPPGHDQGVWVSGRLRGRQAAGWLQMEDDNTSGYRVGPGFSGAAVWDDELDGVVGMAVAAEARLEVRAAYLIPADLLVRAWPGIADQAQPPCPYRGLFAFREQDAPLFFGRQEPSDQLLREIGRRALVAVVGPSGTGKSSLVFAGVLPRLRQRQGWVVATMRPAQAGAPLAALAATLLPLLEPELSQTQLLAELGRLEAVLAQGRLAQVVERILTRTGDERLLLVIDQSEELYTLEPEVARRFVDLILDTVAAQPDRQRQPMTVVVTLRADFLDQALQHAGLAKALQDSTLIMGQMTRDQLRQAIVGPLGQEVTFEAGLVERILDDVGEEPGNLPLLEFTLTQLWDRQERRTLTHAGYEALGGLDGAIARYAEQVYLEDLTPADREAARRLLVQLVEPGPTTPQVRRVARRSELDPPRWRLAQRLASSRLLVTGRDPAGMETVELVHEVLIPGWARLRQWVDADHAFRAWQERLRHNLQAWQDSGRDTGALLRGVPLAEAERWLKQRADDLGPAEQRYITASRALQGRSLRRLRGLSAGLALLVVAALTVGVLAVRESRRADRQSRLATSRYLVGQAEALEQTRPDLALLSSVAAFRIKDTPEAVSRVVRMASDRRDAHRLLVGHTKPVLATAFNPADGRMLVSAGIDNTIAFWDLAQGAPTAPVARVPVSGVDRLAFSHDGRLLASGGSLNEVHLWDPRTHRPLGPPLAGAPDRLLGLSFSPDARLLAGCGDDHIVLWDVQTRAPGQRIPTLQGGRLSSLCGAGFSPDGRQLVYAAGDKVVTWDIARRAIQRSVAVPASPDQEAAAGGAVAQGPIPTDDERENVVDVFVPAPAGDIAVLAADRLPGLVLWDMRRTRPPATPPQPLLDGDRSPTALAFSADGGTVAAAIELDDSVAVAVIDVAHRRSPRLLTGHKSRVTSVTLSPDGRVLAAGGADNTIALFQVEADRLGAVPVTQSRDAAFSADGSRLLTASYEEGIQAWDVARRTRLGASTALASTETERQFGLVVLSPDGRFLAAHGRGGEDKKITLWDLERRSPLGEVVLGEEPATLGALAPGGRVLALAQPRGVVLRDVTRRRRLAVLPGQVDDPGLAFSPDGRRLAVATNSPPGEVVLWEVADPPKRESLTTDGYWELPVFSPDGRRLAIQGVSGIEVWDLAERRLVTTLPVQGRAVFSPDGQLLAASAGTVTTAPPQDVEIWHIGKRTRVASLGVADGAALSFTPDGTMLATVGDDGLALQRFDTAWAVRHICQLLGRDLTSKERDDLGIDGGYGRACPAPLP
jgi:WD40 repeat protein